MTAAPVVVIVIRRPRANSTGYDERQVSLTGVSNETDAQLLRQAADQVEGPTVPPQS